MSENVENRYIQSKVYKLIDQINGYFYIGSTACKTLSKRFTWHKQDAHKEKIKNSKKYQYFNSIGWENVKIILLDEFQFDNKMQLLKEEDKYIQLYRDDPKCLNVIRAYTSEEDRHNYNVTQCKRYRIEHLEHLREYDRTRNKIRDKDKVMCVCGYEYPRQQKAVHDKLRCHIDYIMSKPDNKLTLVELGMLKCDCGLIVTRKGISIHLKTKVHEQNMKGKIENK